MNGNNHLADKDAIAGGSFTDITATLLPLFLDPDGRSGRRWEEVFGLEQPIRLKSGAVHFTVRVRRRSSSDC